MNKENIILDKSFTFSVNVIKLYKVLIKQKEYVISKQLLRSATSIGANIEESIGAESRKDFMHKIQIAYKEARESRYWLKLLQEFDSDINLRPLKDDVAVIIKILGKIKSTTQQNN